jgi:hypothetical protein
MILIFQLHKKKKKTNGQESSKLVIGSDWKHHYNNECKDTTQIPQFAFTEI